MNWAKRAERTDPAVAFAGVVEGVRGIRLLEGEVVLGEGEVIGDWLVPLLGAEAHLVVGGVGDPGAGTVGHREGEAAPPWGPPLATRASRSCASPAPQKRPPPWSLLSTSLSQRWDATRADGPGSAVGDGCAGRPMTRPSWRVCGEPGGLAFRNSQGL